MIRSAGNASECQQAAALSLGPELGATNEVALGQDADQLAGLIDNRQPADAMFQHCIDRINQAGIDADRNRLSRHDLVRAHSG